MAPDLVEALYSHIKMPEHRPRLSVPLALLFAILAVSSASILIRFAQEDAPSLVIAALRLAAATVVLAPLAITRHRAELATFDRRALVLLGLSGLFLAVHFAAWITSLEYTSVASSVVFVSTGPLWVGVFSHLFLRERLSRRTFLGLALAVVGGIIIGLTGACRWDTGLSCPAGAAVLQSRALIGNVLALLGALAVAAYLIIGRRLRGTMSLIPYIFVVYGTAAVVLIGWAILAGQSFLGYAPITYIWIILLALLPQLVGHSTYNWALRYASATLVAVATLGEPVGSSILALVFLDESPSPVLVAGALLILGGVYVVVRYSSLEPHRNRAGPRTIAGTHPG